MLLCRRFKERVIWSFTSTLVEIKKQRRTIEAICDALGLSHAIKRAQELTIHGRETRLKLPGQPSFDVSA